ncbi:hypothetical protein AB0K60_30450 [Thermopolyspora sp. NPDC052614]|uniref:hypothetical protein n=1 Tax=Thermopolyspora sp. NPDC052614 TaxID=3155682 RepID=UPI0034236C23
MAGGVFLVVEGPNGVGKTTTTSLPARRLRAYGRAVHVTSEPSRSQLGRLIRASESTLSGRDRSADKTTRKETFIGSLLAVLRNLPAEQHDHLVIDGDYNVSAPITARSTRGSCLLSSACWRPSTPRVFSTPTGTASRTFRPTAGSAGPARATAMTTFTWAGPWPTASGGLLTCTKCERTG